MKFLWIIILSAILLSSCEIGGESREAVCRHKAVMAALVYSEYYPVRIVRGPSDNGEYHVQAQAYIDGKWRFLAISPVQITVSTEEQDDFYTPEKTFNVRFYINQSWFNKEAP